MSIQSAPYYWLECDTPQCGQKSTEGTDYAAWHEEGEAIEQAGYADWWLGEDGTHHCHNHIPTCTFCNSQLGEDRACPEGHGTAQLAALETLLPAPRPTPPADPVEDAAAQALYDHDYRPEPATPWHRLNKDQRKVYRRRVRVIRRALRDAL